MISSREIRFLIPVVRIMCEKFIEECRKQGITVLITSTYRDNESQDALYAQGRTLPGKKVTNAKGGQSFHNWRVAFDFVPIVNGKAVWNDIDAFNKCGVIGESVGLEWAGRWKKFKELAHFQFTNGLTIKDFQSGKTL
jgi:peptidoglycan L-alanyl-D-glutamate endopeptidase CwlK